MENIGKERPKKTILGMVLVVLSILAMLGEAWGVFSSETLYQWLKARVPAMTAELYWWLKLAIHLGMLTLLAGILNTIHRQRQEAKHTEAITGELITAQRTIEELRSSLHRLQSLNPYLEASPLLIQRTPGFRQHSGIHTLRNYTGFFALLQVANEPKNLNGLAIAYQLYAKVSYCDERWNDLFLPIQGAWFPLSQSYGPNTIGPPESYTKDLGPHQSTYLGIALRYEREKKSPCHALDASSGEWPNWLNPDLSLPRETSYVKVVIGCHGFQATYSYVLKDYGPQEGLQLYPVSDPTSPPSCIS